MQGGRGERVSGLTEIEGVTARMMGMDEGVETKKEGMSRGQLPHVVRHKVENKEAGEGGQTGARR